MTSKPDKQESFRVTLEEKKEIHRLWKASGLKTKQEYLLQAALRGLGDNPAPNDQILLNQLDQKLDKVVSILSANNSSQNHYPKTIPAILANIYKIGVCVKGVEARRVLRDVTHECGDLLISQRMLWEKSKSANGRSDYLDPIIEVPEPLLKYIEVSDLPKLHREGIPNYLKLVNLAGFDLLPEQKKESWIRFGLRFSPERMVSKLPKILEDINTHTLDQLTISNEAHNLESEILLATSSALEATSVYEQVSVLPEVPETANETETVCTHTKLLAASIKTCELSLEIVSDANIQPEMLAAKGSNITPKLPESESVPSADDSKISPDTPNQMTRTELESRLYPGFQGKQRNTIKDHLLKMNPKKVAAWTAAGDPEGLSWQPADNKSREVWNRVS